jgi:hypothetical protein
MDADTSTNGINIFQRDYSAFSLMEAIAWTMSYYKHDVYRRLIGRALLLSSNLGKCGSAEGSRGLK